MVALVARNCVDCLRYSHPRCEKVVAVGSQNAGEYAALLVSFRSLPLCDLFFVSLVSLICGSVFTCSSSTGVDPKHNGFVWGAETQEIVALW